MKYFLVCFLFLMPLLNAMAQSAENEIEAVLQMQQEAWNKGDIRAFMEGYWKSDKLTFTGKAGIIYGWQATLDRYLTTYDSPEAMGQLAFEVKELRILDKKTATLIGSWNLTRPEKGNIGGYFTLIFQKINGKWLIISDHTS